ncbi:MAG: carbohydrate ABC transporter permease [Treponema sp.]|jgi:putative aldouronate transport system permease protein|nr:carbohydrate ABC transporter permease [Treponema sp.]
MKRTKKKPPGRRIFVIVNYTFLTLAAFICLLPLLNQLAISFSTDAVVSTGTVGLLPKQFTFRSYIYMARRPEFFSSLLVSLERIALAVPISLVISVLAAYPLSKQNSQFRARKYLIWYFIVPMLFWGGLIPTYMAVRNTGLINRIWALVIPGAVNVFNILLLMNFFRNIPRELEEAALIDGAGSMRVLVSVILPVSAPVIATVTLFFIVNHWNSWFDGLIYMNSPSRYPLQTYLQTRVIAHNMTAMDSLREVREMSAGVSDRTGKAAQLFLSALPILAVYPFLQKYFTTGIVMGSVKG